MGTPTSRTAYKVYYDVLDRALDSPNGIRIGFSSKGEANQYRVRLNAARTLDRDLNRSGREPDDPQFGLSDYDHLIFKVREDTEGGWWVYLERAAVPGVIEELDECLTSAQPTSDQDEPLPASSADNSVILPVSLGRRSSTNSTE